jgi:hypothetical protein
MSIRIISASILYLLLGLGLAACASPSNSAVTTAANPAPKPITLQTAVPTLSASLLPDLGPAPDFDNEIWLNPAEPQSLASLRGKVVLVEFWTFG